MGSWSRGGRLCGASGQVLLELWQAVGMVRRLTVGSRPRECFLRISPVPLRDPRVASRMLSYPATQATDFTTEEVKMKPEEGRMYVFPGWLEHGVEENQSDEDRISIAFNVLAGRQGSA